jgi:hypothetical protein
MLARMLAVVGVLVANQTPSPSEADWQWLDASREQAFDSLLQLPHVMGSFWLIEVTATSITTSQSDT